MKKLAKKVLAMGLLCVMLLGGTITSSAGVHECAYSYMGIERYNVITGEVHPYTVYNYSTQKMETKSCQILYYYYREVWKCACGDIEYRNYSTVTDHLGACGM